MNSKEIFLKRHKSVALYLFIAAPLFYFITQNNFLVDDWAQLSSGSSLGEQVNSWKSLWSYRPVSWILIPFFLHLFQDNFLLLALLHISLYVFATFQILNWKEFSLSQTQKKTAALLVLSPVFASSFLLSPVNQLSASLSLAFFACGLLVEKYKTKSRLAQILIYSLFLLSIFSYEISFSFIFMHYLFSLRRNYKLLLSYLTFPILLTVLLIWQKIIAPNFLESDFSRFGNLALLPAVSFIFSFLVAIPQFIIAKILTSTFIVFILAGIFFYITKDSSDSSNNSINNRFVPLIALAGFLSNGALFLFSGRYSQITGYGNRGLTSSWFIMAILLVIFFGSKRNLKFFILVFFVAANYLLFCDKLVESAAASKSRSKIIAEIVESPLVREGKPAALVLDLPCFLPNSKFRTEVFCTAWDARGAIKKNGLVVDNVFLLDDRGFTNYLQSLDAEETVILIEFTNEFDISTVLEIDPASRVETFLPYSNRLSARDLQSKECITRIRALFDLQFSGEFGSYLDCVRPLLTPDE